MDVKLKIFEPPRFFEALLRGRKFSEAPDITARICGICPVAYQMSAVHAMENAFHIKIDEGIKDLRRLLYCGEWIESHILHIYLLHAPDFLGFEDSIELAQHYRSDFERGLKIKKIGNQIVSLLGGREIHPINVKVGGFYSIPPKNAFYSLIEDLKWAEEAAIQTVKWVAQFDFIDFKKDYQFVSLQHPTQYPFNEGAIVSSKGLHINADQYENHFKETHVKQSHALHSTIKNQGSYMVGPLARYNLNFDKLTPLTKEVIQEIQFPKFCINPFQSIIVRSIEVVFAINEALRILSQIEWPQRASVPVSSQKAIGYAATEAPRGLLYHKYQLDSNGDIEKAKIVPPTSQNQKQIEEDLKDFVFQQSATSDEQSLLHACEQAVRNYDPCISCATHFLKLHKIEE